MFSKQCKLHLTETNMTAMQHMRHALTIAIKLQLLVPVLIVHSIAPRFFRTTASDTMRKILND
jgi:hypothetical protein